MINKKIKKFVCIQEYFFSFTEVPNSRVTRLKVVDTEFIYATPKLCFL